MVFRELTTNSLTLLFTIAYNTNSNSGMEEEIMKSKQAPLSFIQSNVVVHLSFILVVFLLQGAVCLWLVVTPKGGRALRASPAKTGRAHDGANVSGYRYRYEFYRYRNDAFH
jgi:hypothetical protein